MRRRVRRGAKRVVHDDAAGGGAALAGGADRAEENGAHGQVEVGAGGDDDGVVAAQFEQGAAQAAADDFADVAAHPGGAGGGDERNARVVDQPLADGRAVADDEAEDGGVNVVGAADALGDLDGGDGRERRLAGGLPDGRIAADRGQSAVPGPDGDGEIEGGDDADDAERMPLLHHAVLGALGGDGQAVELAGKADGEVADINHLLHFAFAFGEDLAGFECDEASEVALGLAQGVAELADDFAAFGGGKELPFLEGLLGAAGGAFVFGLGGGADGRQQAAVDGRNARQGFAAAQPLAAEDAGVAGVQAQFFEQGGGGCGGAGWRLEEREAVMVRI